MNATLLFAFVLGFLALVFMINKEVQDARDAKSNYARALFLLSEFRDVKWKLLPYSSVLNQITEKYIARFKGDSNTRFGFEMALNEEEVRGFVARSTGAESIVDAMLVGERLAKSQGINRRNAPEKMDALYKRCDEVHADVKKVWKTHFEHNTWGV